MMWFFAGYFVLSCVAALFIRWMVMRMDISSYHPDTFLCAVAGIWWPLSVPFVLIMGLVSVANGEWEW